MSRSGVEAQRHGIHLVHVEQSTRMTLTVGSLFSGIGGLDLGLERAGMKVIWQSEIDDYACKVLKKHWPEVPNHGDIKQIDWRAVEPVDVICGGYPCQPFSLAGQRKGTDDPRHLWPWVRTAISELRPRYAVLENVRGHLSMGGTEVIGALAEIGYDAEWRVVSAAGMGAPHRRERIIIVAYPNNSRSRTSQCGTDTNREKEVKGRQNVTQPWVGGCSTDMAYTSSKGLERPIGSVIKGNGTRSPNGSKNVADADSNRTQISFAGIFASVKESERITWWETEPDVGRVADGIPNRVDRLKGLGNAVVPQVAEYIGRLITTIG
jgi:DNA (cytosine-5)-methyltransferase 1